MFNIIEQGNIRLIYPQKVTAITNESWTKANMWNRSRIETLDGKTVSQGFGKFVNLNQYCNDLTVTTSDVIEAIKNNDAIATLKIDGSLLIRSVYNNDIILRTRGSFDYKGLENSWEVDSIFKYKYPLIWDINLYNNMSLLFEWVSPNNKIIINYEEPELILIGAVYHDTMKYAKMDEIIQISKVLNVKHTEFFVLDNEGFNNLIEKTKTDSTVEGWVIRIHNEQTLVKVKCDAYLLKHRLKNNVNIEYLIDMWIDNGCSSINDFINYFKETYDEEITLWAMPLILKMFEKINELNNDINNIKNIVKNALNNKMNRKDFAINMMNIYGKSKKFSLIMNLFSGKENNNDIIRNILLESFKE
jgi:hypothetical protein